MARTIQNKKQQTCEFGVSFPKSTVEKIDLLKGQYLTRNKFLLQIVDRYLAENEVGGQEQDAVWGQGSQSKPQSSSGSAVNTTAATTTTNTATAPTAKELTA